LRTPIARLLIATSGSKPHFSLKLAQLRDGVVLRELGSAYFFHTRARLQLREVDPHHELGRVRMSARSSALAVLEGAVLSVGDSVDFLSSLFESSFFVSSFLSFLSFEVDRPVCRRACRPSCRTRVPRPQDGRQRAANPRRMRSMMPGL